MKLNALSALTVGALVFAITPLGASEADEHAELHREGLEYSQAPQIAHELVDEIGARLTNSTNARVAEDWAVEKMKELGLTNVRKEGFEFGRGWDFISSEVRMVSPRPLELTAIPRAWTPGTDGTIEAPVFVAPMENKDDFDAWRGKLQGKFVMIDLPGTGDTPTTVPFQRLEAADIAKRDVYNLPTHDPSTIERWRRTANYTLERDAFLASEGVLAVLRISRRDGKLLHGESYDYEVGKSLSLPYIELAAEDYRRLARLAKEGPAPVISINSNVRFVDTDTQAYNVIGEIRGSDPEAGYVMAGAHLDSWFTGDGAVDNGAGVVAVLEAARIIKALGKQPKRTIRFALWNGEEQGLHGSRAYAQRHLVSRKGEEALSPSEFAREWSRLFPIEPKPGFYEFKGYFNMDNGTGKIRGIYAEKNLAAEPKLQKWMGKFKHLDAGSVVIGGTGGTDHLTFQSLGLPGFQFIQDRLDYFARLHHTNIDTFDHMQMDDLRQASTVMAGVLLEAANDPDGLAREPLPRKPQDTDPFDYNYPED